MTLTRGTNTGMEFSTLDNDNDATQSHHCAQEYGGGWWFNACGFSNLNAPWERADEAVAEIGWYPLTWVYDNVNYTRMSVMPWPNTLVSQFKFDNKGVPYYIIVY